MRKFCELLKALKNSLREEWSKNTGIEWPIIEVKEMINGVEVINEKYFEAHHIIQNNHAGPHEWWNIHPAHFIEEHPPIHFGHDGASKIFNNKQPKE